MMEPKDHLEIFATLVKEMREAQRQYFKVRGDVNLRLSKKKEAEVDDCIRRLLKLGYTIPRERQEAKQTKLYERPQ